MTVELIQGLLLAFAVVVILMPAYIRLLRFAGMGKQIRIEGPETHLSKAGTPTMGGLLVIVVVVLLFYFLRGFPERGVTRTARTQVNPPPYAVAVRRPPPSARVSSATTAATRRR